MPQKRKTQKKDPGALRARLRQQSNFVNPSPGKFQEVLCDLPEGSRKQMIGAATATPTQRQKEPGPNGVHPCRQSKRDARLPHRPTKTIY
ncbi:hypothetical protein CEXT_759831 [Caerostris extrusa]|uniref:Uncharacterized protein n=1 Tax=Caerostris extrusa TaxID=172846 RepID=A0AAV4MGW1_CAEEX|nr:hypothetical protein CEXT_759831 [Caerostris extrusa]